MQDGVQAVMSADDVHHRQVQLPRRDPAELPEGQKPHPEVAAQVAQPEPLSAAEEQQLPPETVRELLVRA